MPQYLFTFNEFTRIFLWCFIWYLALNFLPTFSAFVKKTTDKFENLLRLGRNSVDGNDVVYWLSRVLWTWRIIKEYSPWASPPYARSIFILVLLVGCWSLWGIHYDLGHLFWIGRESKKKTPSLVRSLPDGSGSSAADSVRKHIHICLFRDFYLLSLLKWTFRSNRLKRRKCSENFTELGFTLLLNPPQISPYRLRKFAHYALLRKPLWMVHRNNFSRKKFCFFWFVNRFSHGKLSALLALLRWNRVEI